MDCLDGINGEYGNLIISGWPLALIANASGRTLRVRRKSRSVALPLQPHRLCSMGRTVWSLRNLRTMGTVSVPRFVPTREQSDYRAPQTPGTGESTELIRARMLLI